MLISLHKQATTTPKIRAAIQASTEPAWKVAERYGISEQTVWKWQNRDSVQDRSHRPQRLLLEIARRPINGTHDKIIGLCATRLTLRTIRVHYNEVYG